MAIKTKIVGIPVEVEIVCVQLDGGQTANTVKVLSIGDGKTIYTPEDIDRLHNALEDLKKNPWPIINDILNNIQKEENTTTTTTILAETTTTTTLKPDDNSITKNWYLSRTIWVNIIGLLASTLTIFGLKHQLTSDQVSTISQLIVTVMVIINLYLRKGTNIPLKDIQIPMLSKK